MSARRRDCAYYCYAIMKEMYFMVKFTQRIPRTVAKILFLLLFLIMAVLVLRVYEFIRLSRYNFQQYKKEQQTVFNRLLIDEPPEKLKSFLKCHKNRKILFVIYLSEYIV